MATRSRIGIKVGLRKYLSIYCHWDGYPSHTGKTLKEHYTSAEKITELMQLGDLSNIDKNIGVQHDFEDNSIKDCCTAYGRDRNEQNVSHKTHKNVQEFLERNMWEEYFYLFKNNRWYYLCVHDDNPKLRLLTDKVIRER